MNETQTEICPPSATKCIRVESSLSVYGFVNGEHTLQYTE